VQGDIAWGLLQICYRKEKFWVKLKGESLYFFVHHPYPKRELTAERKEQEMEVLHDLEEAQGLLKGGSCVTIGNFDGVHVGHQALLNKLIERARTLGVDSVVLTFDPHPLKVLKGSCPPFITPMSQKLELLEKQGIDITLTLRFDEAFAQISARTFVEDILIGALKMREMVIGYDYGFGRGREGNYHLLQRMGKEYGFVVWRVEPIYVNGEVVSSTRVRNLVQAGRVWEVRTLLGRFYQVSGKVIEGFRRGGPLLGIPTANLKLVDELFPKEGVYAVWVEVGEEIYEGVANIGYNPTFGNNVLSVETHILDFSRDIYGEKIRVHFVDRIRDERRFSSVEELKTQILKDIDAGREILKRPDARISNG